MRKSLIAIAVLGTLGSALAYADEAPAADAAAAPAATAPAPIVLNGPGMNFPLVGAASPLNFDLGGPVGKVYVSGALTGMAATADGYQKGYGRTKNSLSDITNAQVILQKIDGPVQFFVQAGSYEVPVLGQNYIRAAQYTANTYGDIPTAYVKLVPNDTFSFQVGKLPTLLGSEYTFTYENSNIQRGLLWNQENVFTRGVQANYAKGAVSASVAFTDGFYSKDYSWLSGLISYTIDDANSISAVAAGNVSSTKLADNEAPVGLLNNASQNSQIYNLIYKYAKGPLTIQPILQYTYVPKADISTQSTQSPTYNQSQSTWGGSVIVNYALTPEFNLAARGEYITSSGNKTDSTNLLGFGGGSSAWTATITPTYQVKNYFVRGELSYVKVNDLAAADGFGKSGNDSSQTKVMVETGLLF